MRSLEPETIKSVFHYQQVSFHTHDTLLAGFEQRLKHDHENPFSALLLAKVFFSFLSKWKLLHKLFPKPKALRKWREALSVFGANKSKSQIIVRSRQCRSRLHLAFFSNIYSVCWAWTFSFKNVPSFVCAIALHWNRGIVAIYCVICRQWLWMLEFATKKIETPFNNHYLYPWTLQPSFGSVWRT